MTLNYSAQEESVLYQTRAPLTPHRAACHEGTTDFYAHWHGSLEFIYCLEGSAQITVDGKTFTLTSQEIALVNANQLHDIHSTSEDCLYYCFILDSELITTYGGDLTHLNFQHHIIDSTITNLFDKMIFELSRQQEFYQNQVNALFMEAITHIYRHYRLPDQPLSENNARKIQLVKEGIDYIQQNYTQPLQIETICQTVRISKFHFCRIFKQVTNKTILEYINMLRCYQAQQLILGGEYTIGECAEKIGFQNISYFSKCYQKHIGCLPSVTKKRAYKTITLLK